MNYRLFGTASILMVIAVVLGALGAHALERHLSPAMLSSFETGVRYQIYHALSLLLMAAVYAKFPAPQIRLSVRLMLAGILCFSGSIFAFAIGHLVDVPVSEYLWWVTPLGGLLFLASWIVLFTSSLSIRNKRDKY